MNSPLYTGPRAQLGYVALAAMVALVWIAVLPSRPLFNPDEGRYAEIPREMLASGDWIIPHLNGVPYVEKPPLQYWATAAALRVFGQGEFAARLYTALCALGTLLTVWLAAHRLWGWTAAWRGASVLSSMMLFVVLGQLLTLDMSLTFYMTLGLASFLAAQQCSDALGARRWMLLVWIATGLGVLTKGLVAAVLPAAVLILYSAGARDFSPWRRLHAALGLPLFLLITVPWHWLAARRLADFLQFFFIHEHLSRYMTPSADREEAWWFFAAVLFLGSIPWAPAVLRVLITGWRRRSPRGRFDAALFLWVWAMFTCVFFSLSNSKLIPYILPAFPGLALLIGASRTEEFNRDLKHALLLTVFGAAALSAAGAYGPAFIAFTDRGRYFAALARPIGGIGTLLAVSAVFVLLRRGRDATQSTVFLSVGWCLSGLLLMRAAATVAPIYSGESLARAVASISPDAPLYSVGTYDQTLPFYWRRTLKLAAYRGEMDFGLRHVPDAELPSVAEFVAEWRNIPVGYAVMEKAMFDDLTSRGVPMREVARDLRRVLVARQ